jgi:chromosome segregation ATPase
MDHAGIARSLKRLIRKVNDVADKHTPILADKLGQIEELSKRQAAQSAELKRVRDKLENLVRALPADSPAKRHRQHQLDRVEARIEAMAPKIELLSRQVRRLRDLGQHMLGLIEAENQEVEGLLDDFKTWLLSREEPLRRQVALADRILASRGVPPEDEQERSEAGEAGIDHIVEQVLGENVGEELELLLADMDEAATVGS